MNEEMKFCQSCGMPMQAAGDFGTETDGSPSGEYCVYCYKGGTFTAACTMEEMIRHCAQFHEQFRDENGKSYNFRGVRHADARILSHTQALEKD